LCSTTLSRPATSTLRSIRSTPVRPCGATRAAASGIDFNYGAAPDLQLSATIPGAYDLPAGSAASFGLGNVELAAKYRFLHQDSFGLDVSVFPRVFLPSPWKSVGTNTASLLLPVWVQKDRSGGCLPSGEAAVSLASAPRRTRGGVVTYQLIPKLQLGVELFKPPPPPERRPRIGAKYDINGNYHWLGYGRRGVERHT
jgi:hypothetical protein